MSQKDNPSRNEALEELRAYRRSEDETANLETHNRILARLLDTFRKSHHKEYISLQHLLDSPDKNVVQIASVVKRLRNESKKDPLLAKALEPSLSSTANKVPTVHTLQDLATLNKRRRELYKNNPDGFNELVLPETGIANRDELLLFSWVPERYAQRVQEVGLLPGFILGVNPGYFVYSTSEPYSKYWPKELRRSLGDDINYVQFRINDAQELETYMWLPYSNYIYEGTGSVSSTLVDPRDYLAHIKTLDPNYHKFVEGEIRLDYVPPGQLTRMMD